MLWYKICLFTLKFSEDHSIKLDLAELKYMIAIWNKGTPVRNKLLEM